MLFECTWFLVGGGVPTAWDRDLPWPLVVTSSDAAGAGARGQGQIQTARWEERCRHWLCRGAALWAAGRKSGGLKLIIMCLPGQNWGLACGLVTGIFPRAQLLQAFPVLVRW